MQKKKDFYELYFKMSHAILKILIKVHEKTDLFVLYFASNKSHSFLELKAHWSAAYSTIVLFLILKTDL